MKKSTAARGMGAQHRKHRFVLLPEVRLDDAPPPPAIVAPPDVLANLKAADAGLSAANERLGAFCKAHMSASGDSLQLLCSSFEERETLDREYTALRKAVEVAHGIFQLALARWAATK
jgi:hypothetical protein